VDTESVINTTESENMKIIKVQIKDDIAAVELSQRYITNRLYQTKD
jgi:hypothetical protein